MSVELEPQLMDFASTWEELKEVVKSLYSPERDCVAKSTWNKSITKIYLLCVAKPQSFAKQLYEETKKFLEEHVMSLLMQLNSCGEEQLLTMYDSLWETHTRGMQNLQLLYS